MDHDPYAALAAQWSEQAAQYRADGHPGAELLARASRELAGLCERGGSEDRYVSVAEAATLSGYTRDHLYRMVRDEDLTNYGSRGRIRLRIADLPRKANRTTSLPVAAPRITRPHGGSTPEPTP